MKDKEGDWWKIYNFLYISQYFKNEDVIDEESNNQCGEN